MTFKNKLHGITLLSMTRWHDLPNIRILYVSVRWLKGISKAAMSYINSLKRCRIRTIHLRYSISISGKILQQGADPRFFIALQHFEDKR